MISLETFLAIANKTRKKRTAFVSIVRMDEIYVSALARKMYWFPHDGQAEISFYRETRVLRLRAVDDGGHPVRGGLITPRGFCARFGIKERGRFSVRKECGCLVVELKK